MGVVIDRIEEGSIGMKHLWWMLRDRQGS